jgi:hypothetical protein
VVAAVNYEGNCHRILLNELFIYTNF